MKPPEDRKYTENSLWLKNEGETYAVGLVKPATDRADEFLFLELPEKEDVVEENETLIEYEAMKRVGELILPGKAEVVEVNEEAREDPEKITENPYETWLVKIKPLEDFEDKLLSKNKAEEYYEEQT